MLCIKCGKESKEIICEQCLANHERKVKKIELLRIKKDGSSTNHRIKK